MIVLNSLYAIVKSLDYYYSNIKTTIKYKGKDRNE